MVNWVSKAITTTGSSGSATGSGTISIQGGGILHTIYIDYHSMHVNTDVTITETISGGDTRTLLTVSNNNTSNSYTPMKQAVDSSGAAIANVYQLYTIGGQLNISVAQGNEGDPGVTVSVLVV